MKRTGATGGVLRSMGTFSVQVDQSMGSAAEQLGGVVLFKDIRYQKGRKYCSIVLLGFKTEIFIYIS